MALQAGASAESSKCKIIFDAKGWQGGTGEVVKNVQSQVENSRSQADAESSHQVLCGAFTIHKFSFFLTGKWSWVVVY